MQSLQEQHITQREIVKLTYVLQKGRRSGLIVSASGPGSRPGRGHCVVHVLGQDTQLSQCLSQPRSINGYRRIVGET